MATAQHDDRTRSGATISARAFLASFLVLLALMVVAGILTRAVPAGRFERIGTGASAAVDPGSYRVVERPAFPVWRWFTSPVEVLWSEDGSTAIVIIAFIAIVGGSFAVLEKAGILAAAVEAMKRRFARRRYLLLGVIALFFMLVGSFMGIFEEVVPLVPVAIALALSLGWDLVTGLGMSVLATCFGFAAAVSNPFSIGTAQRIAGVAIFSGAPFRLLVFCLVYVLFVLWLLRTAKRAERGGGLMSTDILPAPASTSARDGAASPSGSRGVLFFAISMCLLIAAVLAVSLTRVLADYSMPITALLFLATGLGSGLVAGLPGRDAARAFGRGVLGLLPGVILILMALSVKRIIVNGEILDTILNAARLAMQGSGPYAAAGLVYLVTLGVEFFVGSATAKAFLLMPIVAPLADLAGLTRQTAVQAYAFGDGFSNMIYPTNAVLLISLGIAGISWPAWARRTWPLQLATLLLTAALLAMAVAIGYR